MQPQPSTPVAYPMLAGAPSKSLLLKSSHSIAPTVQRALAHHRTSVSCNAFNDDSTPVVPQKEKLQDIAAAVSNGTSASNGSPSTSVATVAKPAASTSTAMPGGDNNNKDDKDAPKHLNWQPDATSLAPLKFTPLSDTEKNWTNFKLLFALPWRRFKRDAVLAFKLEGEISDQLQGRFSPGFSMPQICESLEKAAVDPRIKGIAVEINPLQIGWSKVQELRRYIQLFRDSGKFTIAYMKIAGEKEYYLSTAFEEVYVAPSANIRLAGFSVAGRVSGSA